MRGWVTCVRTVYAKRMISRTVVLLLCDKASVIASGGRYLLASGWVSPISLGTSDLHFAAPPPKAENEFERFLISEGFVKRRTKYPEGRFRLLRSVLLQYKGESLIW